MISKNIVKDGIVKDEIVTKAGAEAASCEYRQPEVHDLGKLELVQGLVGIMNDGSMSYFFRP